MQRLKFILALIFVSGLFSCEGTSNVEAEQDKLLSNSEALPKSFSEMEEKEQDAFIQEKVKIYIRQNADKIEFQNYDFLYDYSNKLRPCRSTKYKMKTYFRDSIFVEMSNNLLQSYEYLRSDPSFGEIDTYGIGFKINANTGDVEEHYSYVNFTKWSDGEIGARSSRGSKFIDYAAGKVPNFRAKYGEAKLMAATDKFFETEMRAKQEASKGKCPGF